MSILFLTYARSDGDGFSRALGEALRGLGEGFTVIRDQDECYAGLDWQDWVESSIKRSDVLLFIMTRDSVKSRWCKNEWRLAQRNRIRVIPLLFDRVDPPMAIGDADYVDFTENPEAGFDKLVTNLRRLEAEQPEHRLRVFEEDRAAAERDLRQGGPRLDELRTRKDVAWARERFEQQRRLATDPDGVRTSVEAEIERDLARKGPPARVAGRSKVRSVNEPPYVPESFRNRRPQTKELLQQLRSDAVRLVVVMGREGIGKTALVGRVLTAVSKGDRIDDASLDVSGLVYLKTTGLKPFSASTMLSDLGSLLDEDAFRRLKVLLERSEVAPPYKLMALLDELGDQRVIVLIDNFEQLVDTDTWELRDEGQLSTVLFGLMQLPSHKVKVVLTTQRWPKLSLEHPGMLGFVDLAHEGLPSPYAEEALRAMDRDGSAGLRDAPQELLTKAQELTGGHPKALEALHLLLMTSREISLEEIVGDPDPPHEIAEAWIGKSFSRLGREEQQVLQALAVYGQPVSAAAVDYLLCQHFNGPPAKPVLDRLGRMRLVRKRPGPGRLYDLVLVGRQWLLDTILPGEPADRDEVKAPFTRTALLHHGAEYFRRKQPPEDRCRQLEDLTYHLGEIDLLTLGSDDRAVDLLVRVAGRFLFPWGHGGLVLKLIRPLEEQPMHPVLRTALLIMEGRAHRLLGDHEQAIDRYEQALRVAEELGDFENQAVALTNLGGCYYLLGQAKEAGEHYEAARAAAERVGNRTEAVAALSGQSLCLLDEGHLAAASRLGEQALEVAYEEGDDQQAARQLFNLGLVEVELGNHQAAMERFEAGRQLAERVGNRYLAGRCQQGKAEVLLDRGDVQGAIALAEEAAATGDQIEDSTLVRDANYVLALARLQADVAEPNQQTFAAARAAAETACRFRVGNRAHSNLATLGVVALRQGHQRDAVDAFRQAEVLVRRTLEHGAQHYDALDARGLALSGLALLRQRGDSQPEIGQAITVALSVLGLELADDRDLRRRATEAYRQARAIADAPGVTGRVGRLLGALPDPDGFLAGVKRVAARGPTRAARQRRRDPKLSA